MSHLKLTNGNNIMSDLMERTNEISIPAAIATLQPMVQTKAYTDVLLILAMQPKGYGLDFSTFDEYQLTELQEYNASRFDRREMITDIMYSLTGDCEYQDIEFKKCFTQVITEINDFAKKNQNVTYLNAAVHVCKQAISKQIIGSDAKKEVKKVECEFWGNHTTYKYDSIATAFGRSFKVDAKIVKTRELRADVNISETEVTQYGSTEYFIKQYLMEVVQDYYYAWVHILHKISQV